MSRAVKPGAASYDNTVTYPGFGQPTGNDVSYYARQLGPRAIPSA